MVKKKQTQPKPPKVEVVKRVEEVKISYTHPNANGWEETKYVSVCEDNDDIVTLPEEIHACAIPQLIEALQLIAGLRQKAEHGTDD